MRILHRYLNGKNRGQRIIDSNMSANYSLTLVSTPIFLLRGYYAMGEN